MCGGQVTVTQHRQQLKTRVFDYRLQTVQCVNYKAELFHPEG